MLNLSDRMRLERVEADMDKPPPHLTRASDLLAAELQKPHPLLEPLLTSKSLALLHGPRGLGKTFVAIAIAHAVASGGSFLGWRAPTPRNVLYVDGEMAAIDMQQRLRMFGDPPAKLDLLISDLLPGTMPDLGFGVGQGWLLRAATAQGRRPDLIVLDNLSSLTGYVSGNPDSWQDMQRFLLTLRRKDLAVLAIHHTNKRGLQRGTSRREDILDLVMALRPPAEHRPHDGARFEIHFDKVRGLHGAAVEPVEARLTADTAGRARWEWRPAHEGEFERALRLLRAGFNAAQVARELGISRSWSYRLRDKAIDKGLLSATPSSQVAPPPANPSQE